MTAKTTTYDVWFRAKVEAALEDARATTPHSEVMHKVQELIENKRRERS